MLIRIRHVKKRFYDEDGEELSGYCMMPTPNKMAIQISLPLNKRVNTYAGTVLHELIHAWINVLQSKGFKSDDEDLEEDFVAEVEQAVVQIFKKHFNRRKPSWLWNKCMYAKRIVKSWYSLTKTWAIGSTRSKKRGR